MDAYLADVVQVVPTSFEGAIDEAVAALFMYSDDDPYAVVARFMTDEGEVDWTFSRDLLSDGMVSPAGEGDVKVSPLGDRSIVLDLQSPSGSARLICDSVVVTAFLDQAFSLVPQGDENQRSQIESFLAEISD